MGPSLLPLMDSLCYLYMPLPCYLCMGSLCILQHGSLFALSAWALFVICTWAFLVIFVWALFTILCTGSYFLSLNGPCLLSVHGPSCSSVYGLSLLFSAWVPFCHLCMVTLYYMYMGISLLPLFKLSLFCMGASLLSLNEPSLLPVHQPSFSSLHVLPLLFSAWFLFAIYAWLSQFSINGLFFLPFYRPPLLFSAWVLSVMDNWVIFVTFNKPSLLSSTWVPLCYIHMGLLQCMVLPSRGQAP